MEKFLEDVKNGIYPLIAFAPSQPTSKLNSSPSVTVISSMDNRGGHSSPDQLISANTLSNALISSNGGASASTSHEDPLRSILI